MKSPASRFTRLARAALPAAPLAFMAVPAAKASIVYFNPADVTNSFGSGMYIWLDMGTGGSSGAVSLGPANRNSSPILSPSFYLWFRYSGGRPEWVSNDAGAGTPGVVFDGDTNGIVNSGSYVARVSEVATIGGSSSFYTNYRPFRTTGAGATPWTPDTTGYIGVRFNTNTSTLYGWVQISYNANQSMTVRDFAYETSGGSIQAGAIPEPSTYAALGGLLAGSAALWRRRKQKQAVTAAA